MRGWSSASRSTPMAVNDKLSDAIAEAIDKYQAEVEPSLMVGDVIDTCREIAGCLEDTLDDEDAADPWENGKVLRFPRKG